MHKSLVRDLPASFVVFLISLPLSMGIAMASGVPPELGLFSAIIGGVLVGFLGGVPVQVAGPSAGLTVFVMEIVNAYKTPEDPYALHSLGMIVIVAGLLQIGAGLLRLGTYFRAVSPAVVRGMLGGIGILIIAGQFHVLVDISIPGSGLDNLLGVPVSAQRALFGSDRSLFWAGVIGVLTLVTIYGWERVRPARLKMVPGPLLGALLAALLANLLELPILFVSVPENLLGALRVLPSESFGNLSGSNVWLSGAALAFVASAETLLCATAVSRMRPGPRSNYNRELIAQGVTNSLCGTLGLLPVTGVISRSTANIEAGATSRWSTILQGLWVAAFVLLLPGLLKLVPTSSLAAILIYVGLKLINPTAVRQLLTYGRSVGVVYLATVVGIVTTDLLTGILIGIALSFGKLLYALAHLEVEAESTGDHRVDVHFHGSATFVALPTLGAELEKLAPGKELHVHIDELNFIDHACLELLSAFRSRYEETGGSVTLEWDLLLDRFARGGVQAETRRRTLTALPAK